MSVSLLLRRPAARCLGFRKISCSGPTARTLVWPGQQLASARRLFATKPDNDEQKSEPERTPTIRENIYTIPNLLTASRIVACPILGYAVLHGDFTTATFILAYAGATDWIDGYIARRWKQHSVLGTILDPAADKALVTTLTVTLAISGMLPVPLAVIIIGRDVLLSLSAFYYRYISLPAPKTFARYWDFGIPSAEVRPTQISKINTALQLLLMGVTTVNPVLPLDLAWPILGLQWTVGATTIWSGLSYVFSKDAVRILREKK
ncbi:hypothetical protein EXIGLDRAFT_722897 [Exidia glandulosa HHB12029]|uniref:CDP-alcohol phosphatidyltransferase n=1 Tax=Exidia glandulosa HHB12029 TaxID=1314781 RepID=A0A165F1Y8_EXIGL|nr:hypothetical protein EXIGLDRAFT_722897 [Exidia glandulosa HHB12029]